MKALYEITNGYTGESYVRCYAWADNEAEAIELARRSVEAITPTDFNKGVRDLSTANVRLLFPANASSFCTPLDDSGFPDAYVVPVR